MTPAGMDGQGQSCGGYQDVKDEKDVEKIPDIECVKYVRK
jgi:hypothetical protein